MLTDEQKLERLKGLGGSDIAAALGVSPWKTQLELWGEKTGLAPDEFTGNEATYWGSAVETLLRDRFSQDHAGKFCVGTYRTTRAHTEHKCLRASADGFIYDGTPKDATKRLGIWEGKTSAREFTEVPAHYQLQVQHYMYVFDLPFAIISVLFHGNKYEEFRIERDPTYATEIVPALLQFWSAVEDKLPVFKPVKVSDVKILMDTQDLTVAGTKTVEHDSGYERVLDSLARNMVRENQAKGKISKLKAILMADMSAEGVKTLKRNGKAAATIVTVADSQVFDAADFRKVHPVLASEHQKIRKGYVSLRVSK